MTEANILFFGTPKLVSSMAAELRVPATAFLFLTLSVPGIISCSASSEAWANRYPLMLPFLCVLKLD